MRVFAAIVIASLGMTVAGQAATISFADGATLLASSCGADIKKLCKGLNLGNNRIFDCIVEKQAQVSPQCISDLAAVRASIQARLAAQASVPKICRNDVANRCPSVKPGDAHLLTCLLKAQRTVSAKCNQAITDAGWR